MMGGGRGRGGEGSGSLNQGAHLRGGVRSTSNRLREDLQAVVRSSLTPLMEPVQPPSSLASHLSALLPPSTSGAPSQHQQSAWPQPTPSMAGSNPGSLQAGTSWQENITVTIQQQPSGFSQQHQQPHHVLDMEVEQGGGAGGGGGGGAAGGDGGEQEQES